MSSSARIVVYGGGSGSGKTSLVVALLGVLRGWAAVKISPSALYCSVRVEDDACPGGKDTARMAAAGARPVIHLQCPAGETAEGLSQALDLVPAGGPAIIEGRAALSCLTPDLAVFVWRPGLEDPKQDPAELAEGADIVVINGPEAGTAPAWEPPPGAVVVRGCLDGERPEVPAGLAAVLEARGLR